MERKMNDHNYTDGCDLGGGMENLRRSTQELNRNTYWLGWLHGVGWASVVWIAAGAIIIYFLCNE
jgi:hypothetical protein